MNSSLSLFGATFSDELSPCDRLSQLDRELVPYTEPRHQNCAFCYVELDHRILNIANAGGIPPFIRRRSGEVERPQKEGYSRIFSGKSPVFFGCPGCASPTSRPS